MADQPPRGKLDRQTLRLTLTGDTSHLTVSDLVRLGQAIDKLLRALEMETEGGGPRIKWVITKLEKDD